MTPRPIKELLQILLDNIDLLESGFCKLIDDLLYKKIISYNEYYKIFIYIKNNSPAPIYNGLSGISGYRFPHGDKESRKKWLINEIKSEHI